MTFQESQRFQFLVTNRNCIFFSVQKRKLEMEFLSHQCDLMIGVFLFFLLLL